MTLITIDMEDLCIAAEGDTSEDKYGIFNAQPAIYTLERINEWKELGYKVIVEVTDRDVDIDYDTTHHWIKYYNVQCDDVNWKIPNYNRA